MRARPSPDERGSSLAELLVVMLVSSVVFLAVGTLFTGSLTSTSAAVARNTANADVRLAADTVARRLRVAVRPDPTTPSIVVQASTRALTFYASLAPRGATTVPGPTKVEYSIDTASACLREALTPASGAGTTASPWTWPVAARASRCLAFGTVNADGAPVFSYFDTLPLLTAAGPTAPAALASDAAGTLAAPLDSVVSVQVVLHLGATGVAGQVASAQTQVTLVNRVDELTVGKIA